uniref:L-galactose dehydrogenase n=1 Tax=Phallusia mammillata TaxID=59560 RepID=A0A6F9DVA1_9ASCI|nr:L-galactose dehydrogenase [Phallusia mammillata]
MVPKMTFGCAAIGSVYRPTDDKESILVTKEAIKQGLNMIDTAPWYGCGKSEKVLGEILPKLPRKSFYINTKVGRYLPEYEKMFDFSAERVIQSVDESLSRLGLDYVDIIQVHDLEFAPSIDQIINETLPALQKVKESGKARYIGITAYPLDILRTVVERSTVKIDAVLTYCHGSMNDNSLQDNLPFFKSHGIGVINASILSMGLLTNRELPDWHPAANQIILTCEKAKAFCLENAVDITRIATHFSLTQPGIDTTLISTASLGNLKKNIQVFRNGITEKEQLISDDIMKQFFKPLNNATWGNAEVVMYQEKLKQAVKTSLQ